MKALHNPVLLSEVIAGLKPKPGDSYLDLTAGYAGHASEILAVTQNYKNATLVDRDEYAIKFLEAKYPNHKDEGPEIIHRDFYNAMSLVIECGKTYDMILADFGVSSPQLDLEDRGFSFSKEGPLDMRMDRKQELTAADIVNKWSLKDLIEIFEKYGEMSPGFSRKVAREIVMNRPFQTTTELAQAIAGNARHSRIHPATRAFQAIRIVVNDELGQIERTLPLLSKALKPGGRVGIITFHSLEDRLVKNYFKEASSLGEESELKLVTKSPITAEETELVINPRARSAKLRVAVKR
ncbi:16S rRNA (cytosine(1402)-N(4))-methyltransferase RsmH [Candidatus Saccharibacteria bacterium]|nr:16S rRNA (cytosine(1402)-N(4))-methyltransferase RsmH [Candidatus Saccharibacteria bacterium]